MVEKSKIFYWESEPEFSFFGRGKDVVNFHDSCQKNKELSRLAEQKEHRAGLVESSTGRISYDKPVSVFS